jgi:uncharacterized membrane-anchored protein
MKTSWLRRSIAVVVLTASVTVAQEDPAPTAEQLQAFELMQQQAESLNPQTGEIVLEGGLATLQVPESFYFLDARDAETVLVDLWGNPPGQDVLGMLFPAQYSPLDFESWAVTIDYSEDGFVADDDAADIDYSDLLRDMQKETRDANDARVEAGYDPVQLVGWAEQPYYDASAKKLYWAKELQFGDSDGTTLNYEIRALGRRGVLSMTFIAATSQLGEINASRDTVLAMTEFNEGHRYIDFDPDIDEVAAYGIGALIAGKVAAKAGLFAAALLFLKKFGVFILLGIAFAWRKIMGLFKTDTLGPK